MYYATSTILQGAEYCGPVYAITDSYLPAATLISDRGAVYITQSYPIQEAPRIGEKSLLFVGDTKITPAWLQCDVNNAIRYVSFCNHSSFL